MRAFLKAAVFAAALALPATANAFCGFYVAKGDADLFNEASKVVMVRDGDRTVITMANDFQGEVRDFAMVIPAPTVLKREQIHVTENGIIDHLDAYTAPRLVEYFDENPCRRLRMERTLGATMSMVEDVPASAPVEEERLGVTIEAEYTVGEYDILILSAEESDGLSTWLTQNGYRIPDGAGPVLGSYINQGMKFFVARVNLKEHASSGNAFLRPLQIAFESKKFMLPIRLGTVNSKGKQDLLLWTLTRTGRVETANYRTLRMPTGQSIPTYVKDDFGPAYKAIYGNAVERAGGSGVLMEYAWDMGWCDPCAADPLSNKQLRELGVFWVEGGGYATVVAGSGDLVSSVAARLGIPAAALANHNNLQTNSELQGGQELIVPPGFDVPDHLVRWVPPPNGGAVDVFVTRLHARYDAVSFPEDLRLIETGDRQNFQGRYVLNHPWMGTEQCPAADEYRKSLPDRWEDEAKTLASLTGWDITDIRAEMTKAGQKPDGPPWWEKIWNEREQ
ncbi:MAG: DUF2330 domain-containing protein [Pseudomonadota bacterium]